MNSILLFVCVRQNTALGRVRSSLTSLADLGRFTLKLSDMGLGKQLAPGHSSLGLPSNEPKRRTTRQRKKKGGNGDRDNDDEAEEGEDRAGATAAAAAAAVTAGQSSVQTSSGFGGVGTIGWSAPEVIALRSATEASFGGGRGGSVSSNKDDGVAAMVPSEEGNEGGGTESGGLGNDDNEEPKDKTR